MKIIIFGCGHGVLPKIEKCDLCIVTGDNIDFHSHQIDFQIRWMNSVFQNWVIEQKENCKYLVYINGNHCLYAETNRANEVKIDGAIHLRDSFIEIEGLRIYGSPFSPTFGRGWAFNKSEKQLDEIYSKIDNADIVINHSPPYKYNDKAPRYGRDILTWEHAGSKSLLKLIDRISPKLLCCSHLHSGYGTSKRNNTIIVNGSIMNEDYQPVNKPIIVEI